MRSLTTVAVLAACGCATSPVTPSRGGRLAGPEPNRRLCGWEHLGLPGIPSPIAVAPAGEAVGAGERIAVVRLAEEATVTDLILALRPAARSLVRVKLAMDDSALLALTIPHRADAGAVLPGPKETAIVGHRKVTRPQSAPRDRFADLRVEDGEVTVFVENDKPGGDTVAIEALKGHLLAIQPPVGVFTLGANGDTPWPRLRDVLVAAACFDRGPGDEPHEVLLPLPDSPSGG